MRQKTTAILAFCALAGALLIWAWSTRGHRPPPPQNSPPVSTAPTLVRLPALEEPGSARDKIPPLLRDLLEAQRTHDAAREAQYFAELQKQLLQSRDSELADAVCNAIKNASLDKGLRLGLLEALIQGASAPVIPGLIDLFHTSKDPEIKSDIVAKLPEIQGEARLVDQGVNVAPELMSAFSGEQPDSALLGPLAQALAATGDEKALSFLIGQASQQVKTLQEMESSQDPRLAAAVAALTNGRISSAAAVPALARRLDTSQGATVDAYLTTMTLSSIGNPAAIQSLLHFFETAPDDFAPLAEASLSRLTHPEAQMLLQTAAANGTFQSSSLKATVVKAADHLTK